MRNTGGTRSPAGVAGLVYCTGCHHRLRFVPEVGWVDPGRTGAYDMCDADPFANHWPTTST